MSAEPTPHSAPREIAEELAHDDWTLEVGGDGHYAHPESVIGRSMRLARAYRDLEEQLETLCRELGKVRDGVEVVHEEDVGMWAAGVLAMAESSPAKK